MKTIGGTRYLEQHDLKQVMLYERLKKAKQRGAPIETIADPSDRHKHLWAYDSLPEDVKSLIDAVHDKAAEQAMGWNGFLTVNPADLAVLRNHVLPDGGCLPEGTVLGYATECSYLRLLATTRIAQVRAWGYATAEAFYAAVRQHAADAGVKLPASYSHLRAAVRSYKESGAASVVSGKWGNSCALKIGNEQHAWLVASYAQPNKPDTAMLAARYAEHATTVGWPALTEDAIYKHLHQQDVMPVWYIGRHGSDEWYKKYAHTMSTRGPVFRDALWCSDGTKLNYWYRTDDGQKAMLKVYLIMDVYSEAIIGHSFSAKENFQAQYSAAKMAIKRSGNRPLQWLYDGQGGHVSKDAQDFYTRAVKLHFPAKPYNAKSKPIENLIGRLQKKVMRDRWFFTGQNIQSKRLDSRPNMEFVLAHLHKLPTLDEALAHAAQDIDTWNGMPHPKAKVARMQMYAENVSPMPHPLDFMDFVELFWITKQREVRYTNEGLTLEVGGQRLKYEVYGADELPDAAFLRRWTNASFVVRYDPEQLAAGVMLYRRDEQGRLRLVSKAMPKKRYARAVVDLMPGERAEIDATLALRAAQRQAIAAELEALRNSAGIDPETLVEIGYRGDKQAMDAAEHHLTMQPLNDDEDLNLLDIL